MNMINDISEIDYTKGDRFKSLNDCLKCSFVSRSVPEIKRFLNSLSNNDLKILMQTKYVLSVQNKDAAQLVKDEWDTMNSSYTTSVIKDYLCMQEVCDKNMHFYRRIMHEQKLQEEANYLESCICDMVIREKNNDFVRKANDYDKELFGDNINSFNWDTVGKILEKKKYLEDFTFSSNSENIM